MACSKEQVLAPVNEGFEPIKGNAQSQAFLCTDCGKFFKTKKGLTQHHAYKHKKGNYKCFVCDKFLPYKQLYMDHMDVHTKIQRHECVCGAKFTFKQNLNAHKKTCKRLKPKSDDTNTTPKPTLAVCPTCGKGFPTKRQLTEHVKGMHGAPRYQCKDCSKGFKWRGSLRKHKC